MDFCPFIRSLVARASSVAGTEGRRAFDGGPSVGPGYWPVASGHALHDTGQPENVQEVIAKRIIDIAETGERDPDKMCERVLLTFGLSA